MNDNQPDLFLKIKTLLESLTLAERATINVREVLAERGAVAITWSIDDVRHVRPDLSREQAWDVLVRCRDKHDPEWGFTWSYLKDVAALLYPAAGEPSEEELA
jgi:hypothetical protein